MPFPSISITNAKQLRTVQKSAFPWHQSDIGGTCASLVHSWCVGGAYWGLSWLCLWLLMGGSAALVLNSSPFLRVSRICSVSVNANNTMKSDHHVPPTQQSVPCLLLLLWDVTYLYLKASAAATLCRWTGCPPRPLVGDLDRPTHTWHWLHSGWSPLSQCPGPLSPA